jgi:hypothetical protein
MTASAFSLTLTVPAEGFEVIAGEPVIGGLHGAIRHYFCPRCKSWMFTRPMKDFVNVRPSVLDDHDWFVPFAEFFTDEKLPWAATPAVHSFASAPEFEVYAGLIEEFAKDGARPE